MKTRWPRALPWAHRSEKRMTFMVDAWVGWEPVHFRRPWCLTRVSHREANAWLTSPGPGAAAGRPPCPPRWCPARPGPARVGQSRRPPGAAPNRRASCQVVISWPCVMTTSGTMTADSAAIGAYCRPRWAQCGRLPLAAGEEEEAARDHGDHGQAQNDGQRPPVGTGLAHGRASISPWFVGRLPVVTWHSGDPAAPVAPAAGTAPRLRRSRTRC
jgi:hypothetical protein